MTDPKRLSFSHAKFVFFRTLLALLVLAAGAPVFAQLSEDLESIEVTETPEDVEAYWTPERMAAAEPTEIVGWPARNARPAAIRPPTGSAATRTAAPAAVPGSWTSSNGRCPGPTG